MWDVFFLKDPFNEYNNWDILLIQSIFTLDYVKHKTKILKEGSDADQYMVHNLTWS